MFCNLIDVGEVLILVSYEVVFPPCRKVVQSLAKSELRSCRPLWPVAPMDMKEYLITDFLYQVASEE